MKFGLKEVKVDQEIFKKIKKYNRVIYVEDGKYLEGIESNDKVIVENALTLKKIKRKVINVYKVKDKDELINILGKKEKYIYPEAIKKEMKKDESLIAIEFKSKKKILSKILVGLLIILIGVVLFMFVRKTIDDINNKNLRDSLSELNQEITYVIVEVNPSIILELVDGKVKDKACLNEDCQNMFSDIDVKNKSIKTIVEELYNNALELELDLSNGVKVSSVSKDIEKEINSLQYVIYNNISKDEENNYIDVVLDNDAIKNLKKQKAIAAKRLTIYKKHKYYDTYFECDDFNGSLECYITDELAKELENDVDSLDLVLKKMEYGQVLESIMDLFNIKYKVSGFNGLGISHIDGIYIDNKYYDFFVSASYSVSDVDTNASSNSANKTVVYNDFAIRLVRNTKEFYYELLPMTKFELITKTYKEEDVDILKKDFESGNILLNGEELSWQS